MPKPRQIYYQVDTPAGLQEAVQPPEEKGLAGPPDPSGNIPSGHIFWTGQYRIGYDDGTKSGYRAVPVPSHRWDTFDWVAWKASLLGGGPVKVPTPTPVPPIPEFRLPDIPMGKVIGGAVFIIGAAAIIARFGLLGGRFFMGTIMRLGGFAASAGRVTIPGRRWSTWWPWVRTALVGLGAMEGADIVFDFVEGMDDVIDSDGSVGGEIPDHLRGDFPGAPATAVSPFTPGIPTPFVGQVGIVGTWVANGITFYRLSDGKLAVQNKKGRWKVWRPKRPVVIMPGGVSDLRSLVRADRVISAQVKALKKMIDRRTTYRPSRSSKSSGVVIVESGPGSVVTRK